jgi:hypothetical protein
VPAEAVAFKTTLPTPQLPALNTGVIVGIALTVKVTVEVIPQIFASLLNLMRYRYPDISTVTLESVSGTAVR